nr:P3 protein [Carrot umbra-like virus 1]
MELTFPAAPSSRWTKQLIVETYLPSSSQSGHEAYFKSLPLGKGSIDALARERDATHYRVKNVRIMCETATSNSTQIVGIGNAPSKDITEGTGYGKTSKAIRACYWTRRSPVGGNIDITWPVSSMGWKSLTDDTTDNLPNVLLAVTNPSSFSTTAWYEVLVTVDLQGQNV